MKKKLRLSRETLSVLSESSTQQAKGAATEVCTVVCTFTCYPCNSQQTCDIGGSCFAC